MGARLGVATWCEGGVAGVQISKGARNSPHIIFQFGSEGLFGIDLFLAINRHQHCLSDLYSSGRVRNITFFWPVALAACQSDYQERKAEHRANSHVESPFHYSWPDPPCGGLFKLPITNHQLQILSVPAPRSRPALRAAPWFRLCH